MEVLAFDAEVYPALGLIGWARVLLGTGLAAIFALFVAAFALACAREVVGRGVEPRERLYALVGLGLAGLMLWGCYAVLRGGLADVLAEDDDFTAIELAGGQVRFTHAARGPVLSVPAGQIAALQLSCRLHEDSSDGDTCTRAAEVRLADGRVLRVADRVDAGLTSCRGVLDDWAAKAARVAGAERVLVAERCGG